MSRATILILDGGPIENPDHLSQWLTQEGYTVIRMAERETFVRQARSATYDLLIVHDRLLDREKISFDWGGLSVDAKCPVIAFGKPDNVGHVLQLLQSAVVDYIFKPVDKEILTAAVSKALSAKQMYPPGKAMENMARPIITQSAKMRHLLDMAQRIALSDATVLIQGESGTGKELLARYIHRHSSRSSHVFIGMNCAALPENLAESELFGYEKGAFTGAFKRSAGKFETAQQGTLLLDEISEIQPALQAKLLRVLQEKQITRLGGNDTICLDVRLIATTNRDLVQMIRQGLFREDLYYRLRVIPLTIPPLREHSEDISYLANYFLKKFSGESTIAQKSFDNDAMQCLLRWPWPGNIRELENTIQRAALISTGPVIHREDLLLEEEGNVANVSDASDLVGRTVKEVEKTLIEQTLAHVHFNRTHAARLLGISIRTLRNKLNEFKSETPAMADPKSVSR